MYIDLFAAIVLQSNNRGEEKEQVQIELIIARNLGRCLYGPGHGFTGQQDQEIGRLFRIALYCSEKYPLIRFTSLFGLL